MAINMRTPLAIIGALAAVSAAQAQELTISYWGGKASEEFKRNVVEPFQNATGVTVRVDGGLASERLAKLSVTKGRGLDIIYLTDYQMAEAKERGLLQPVDPANMPNLANLYDFAKDPLGGGTCPAFTVAGVGLAYNKDHFAEPPKSWADLFREGLPGKAGYVDMAVSYGPLMLIETAQLYGGGIDNIDPGFDKLKELKDSLQFFSLREILDSINQGDVSIAPHLNIFVVKDESVPLRFSWPDEGGLGVLNMACVVAGSEHSELAQKFIDFHLSVEAQTGMLRAMGETPVNTTVSIPEGLPHNYIPSTDIEKLQFFDVDKIVSSRNDWLNRWREEILAQ